MKLVHSYRNAGCKSLSDDTLKNARPSKKLMAGKYAVSFADEAILAAFNFLLNIVLIRSWSPTEYGIFALWLVVMQVLTSVQNALVTTPLSVDLPSQPHLDDKAQTETVLASVNALLMTFAFGVAAVIAYYTIEVDDLLMTAIAIGGFLFASLARTHIRALAFARMVPQVALMIDVIYVGVCASIFIGLSLDESLVTIGFVFGILGLSQFAAAMAGLAVIGALGHISLRPSVLFSYSKTWTEARWSLLGVATSTVQSRVHVILVTGLAGAAAFGRLNAGQVLFGPVRMFLTAYGLITRPFLAKAISEERSKTIYTINYGSLAALTLVLGSLFGVFLLAWEWIDGYLFAGKYVDMKTVCILWAINTTLFAFGEVYSVALQALRQFKRLSHATLIGAGVSLVSVLVLLLIYGPTWCLLGIAMGELTALVYRISIFRDVMNRRFGDRPANAYPEPLFNGT